MNAPRPRGLRPRSRGIAGPVMLMVAGMAAGPVGLLILVLGAFSTVGTFVDDAQDRQTLEPGQTHTLPVDAGVSYLVAGEDGHDLECQAFSADRQTLRFRVPDGIEGTEELVLEPPVTDTTITLECESLDGSPFHFGPQPEIALGGIAVGAVVSVLFMGAGLVMFVAAIIWLAVRRAQSASNPQEDQ